MRNIIALTGIFLLLVASSEAAIKKNLGLKFNRLDAFADSGVFQGGEAGRAYSLLGIVRAQPKKATSQRERFAIQYGDETGRRILGKTGYFHITLEENPPRLIIDLMQVQKTAIDEKQLAAIFRNSNLISGTKMTMDPEDLSTNITIYLKDSAKAKVTANQDPKKSGQVVVDIVKQNKSGKPNVAAPVSPKKGLK